MRVELARLEDGRGEFGHQYQAGELSLDDERIKITAEPEVTGAIRQDGSRVKLSGQVKGGLGVECDRCLKPVHLAVNSSFRLDYVTAKDYQQQQAVELEAEDLDLAVFDGEAIDVDALVAEELFLAIPDHVLCKNDCLGICAVCGVDRNSADCNCESAEIDPRWAALKTVNRE